MMSSLPRAAWLCGSFPWIVFAFPTSRTTTQWCQRVYTACTPHTGHRSLHGHRARVQLEIDEYSLF